MGLHSASSSVPSSASSDMPGSAFATAGAGTGSIDSQQLLRFEDGACLPEGSLVGRRRRDSVG